MIHILQQRFASAQAKKETGMEGKSLGSKLRIILSSLYYPLFAIVAAFAVGSIIIRFTSDSSPLEAYLVMFRGAFGSLRSWDDTIIKAIPFIFTAISFAIAKRCGIINLGGEGQFMIGALASTVVGVGFSSLPYWLHLPMTLAAGFLGGALYGVLVAALKIRFGASELITTIMLNYIARQIIAYAVNGPVMDTTSRSYPQSALIADSAKLYPLFDKLRLHSGFLIMIGAVLFYYIFMWKTATGFEMRVVGFNPGAGCYAGMNINRASLLAMFLAGGFAGLGGCIEIIAVQDRLMMTSFSVSYGFTGIAVALLGGNLPLGMVISGVLFGGLETGSGRMQALTNASASVVLVVQALVILFVAGRELFHFGKHIRRHSTTGRSQAELKTSEEKPTQDQVEISS